MLRRIPGSRRAAPDLPLSSVATTATTWMPRSRGSRRTLRLNHSAPPRAPRAPTPPQNALPASRGISPPSAPNWQVAAALEHSQRITAKADDFDKLMRSQAQQIEADARMRASEHLERAREKAQRIIDAVTAQADTVLRDAEDRTRQLRWQQHQLTSFMAEVKEMIRPDGVSAQPPSSEWEPSEYRDAAAGADIAPTGDGAAEHA